MGIAACTYTTNTLSHSSAKFCVTVCAMVLTMPMLVKVLQPRAESLRNTPWKSGCGGGWLWAHERERPDKSTTIRPRMYFCSSRVARMSIRRIVSM